ncbi:hypothetical protein ACQKFM_31300 [Paenibacillus xylanexedens]|uniref:hypothetical protein n=1 Tax=Paenibacillus xylanexedens TaxID=528191 RepID=UPI003CFE53DB
MNIKEMEELVQQCKQSQAETLDKMSNLLYVHGDEARKLPKYRGLEDEYNRYISRIETLEEVISKTARTGRPPLGVGKTVKITLPEEDWQKISTIVENGHASSVADYFRQLHQHQT